MPTKRHLFFFMLILLQGCATTGIGVDEDLGKRTTGTKWDDQMVESRGKTNIRAAHPELENAHINITSFNGVVLITGQVPSTEAKTAATEAVSGLRKVQLVHNELEIAGPISFMARTNDTWLTTKVKTALLIDDDAESIRVKVVTANSTVYLMGLLTREEAEAAVTRAREVFGIQKIVKVFEYIN